MKKLICVILLSLISLYALGMVALAFEPDDPKTIIFFNPVTSYTQVRDSAFYMYYGPYCWDTHCWSSSKVSVADDHQARAYAYIKSGNKTNYETLLDFGTGGYVETAGAFLDEPKADFIQHYGKRYENDGTNPEWNVGYRSTGTLSLNEN